MGGAPDQRQFPILQEGLQHASQRQLPGLTVHQRQQDGSEIALQRCAALQVLQNSVRIGVSPQFHNNPHAFAIALIADISNAADLSVVDLFSKLFDPASLAQLVRQFSDDHRIALVPAFSWLYFLHVGHTTHRNAAASAQIGVADSTAKQHFAACGEIRPGNQTQ